MTLDVLRTSAAHPGVILSATDKATIPAFNGGLARAMVCDLTEVAPRAAA